MKTTIEFEYDHQMLLQRGNEKHCQHPNHDTPIGFPTMAEAVAAYSKFLETVTELPDGRGLMIRVWENERGWFADGIWKAKAP